jgi:CRP-like cAMP-binding protein
VDALARLARTERFEPDELVLEEGDADTRSGDFHIVRSGTADVLRRDRSGTLRLIARLATGSYFGELGLLTNQARTATIRVCSDTPLATYTFDALTFHQRIAEHVLGFRVLRQQAHAHSGSGVGTPRVQLRGLELLDRMPKHDLEFVLASSEQRWYPAGTPIIRSGEAGDRFYVLLEGEAQVERDGEVIAGLERGDFFGETALLLDMPRSATVRTTTHALTWSITRRAFQQLVGSYLLGHARTQAEVMRRVRTLVQPRPEDSSTLLG